MAYDAMGVVSMLTPTGGVDRGPKAEASVWEMGRVVCCLVPHLPVLIIIYFKLETGRGHPRISRGLQFK